MAVRISIPIIDLFAGPGGLGEGFSAYSDSKFNFDIKLSIEKEYSAAKTLALRKFFRKFPNFKAPDAYYDYVRGDIFEKGWRIQAVLSYMFQKD